MGDAKRLFNLYTRRRKKGRPIYYARFRLPDGSWSSGKNTGETNAQAAETWALNYLSENGGKIALRDSVMLGDYAAGFFSWGGEWALDQRAAHRRVNEALCVEKQRKTDRFVVPILGGKTRLQDIDRRATKRLRNELFVREYSSSHINKTLACLNAILLQAEEEGLIRQAPRMERAGGKGQSRGTVTLDEARQLFSVPWGDIRALTANVLAATTGMRMGEILALKESNIRDHYVWVDRGWNVSGRFMNDSTKTGTRRRVPLHPTVEQGVRQVPVFVESFMNRPDTFQPRSTQT